MNKKVDTWMPWLVDKYLGDTTHLTTELHGAYFLLLLAMWKKDGVLPNDDAQLQPITRLTPARWKACRAVLLAFFRPTEDGTGLTQKRLTIELKRAKAHTNAKSEAGAKGAAKRWQKDGESDGTDDGKKDGSAMADASQSHWRTDAPIPIPTPSGEGSSPPPRLTGAGDGESEPPVTTTAYGLLAGRIRRELQIASVSSGNQTFRTLVDAGATFEEFQAYAEGAKTARDPFAYLVKTVANERQRAAQTASQLHRGPMPRQETAGQRASRERAEAFVPGLAARHAAATAAPPTTTTTITEVIDVPARRLG